MSTASKRQRHELFLPDAKEIAHRMLGRFQWYGMEGFPRKKRESEIRGKGSPTPWNAEAGDVPLDDLNSNRIGHIPTVLVADPKRGKTRPDSFADECAKQKQHQGRKLRTR